MDQPWPAAAPFPGSDPDQERGALCALDADTRHTWVGTTVMALVAGEAVRALSGADEHRFAPDKERCAISSSVAGAMCQRQNTLQSPIVHISADTRRAWVICWRPIQRTTRGLNGTRGERALVHVASNTYAKQEGM